jgi:hypothetical protein
MHLHGSPRAKSGQRHPCLQFQNGTASSDKRRNSNVSKILPVTTLRTIDLAGRKIPDCLFSRFCAVSRVFFEPIAQTAERF